LDTRKSKPAFTPRRAYTVAASFVTRNGFCDFAINFHGSTIHGSKMAKGDDAWQISTQRPCAKRTLSTVSYDRRQPTVTLFTTADVYVNDCCVRGRRCVSVDDGYGRDVSAWVWTRAIYSGRI